jgi:uncharacterized iron-regulated membrane protein
MAHPPRPSASRRTRLQQIWLRTHLWLGLTVGAVLAVIGLTGSLLVFYTDLDEALLLRGQPAPSGAHASHEAALRTLREAWPERTRAWRLELPSDATRYLRARYDHPVERADSGGYAPLLVWLDPGTLAIRHHAFWGDTPMTWLYNLHYTLLGGNTGRTLVGGLGLVALLSAGTGLALWWPRGRQVRPAFAVRLGASRARTTYDLHKIGGVYLLPLTLLLIVTGTLLALPGPVRPALARLSPLAPPVTCASTPAVRPISADTALAAAQRRFPRAVARWLDTPDSPTGCYRVRLEARGEPSARFPATLVWIDPATAAVRDVRDARRRSAGDALLAWLHPLHSGEAFGLAGRLAVLLAGLALPLLFVTGCLRWYQKRAARATTARRRTA